MSDKPTLPPGVIKNLGDRYVAYHPIHHQIHHQHRHHHRHRHCHLYTYVRGGVRCLLLYLSVLSDVLCSVCAYLSVCPSVCLSVLCLCVYISSYEKRKQAALEIESIIKESNSSGSRSPEAIRGLIDSLGRDYIYSTQANFRKGGLISFAAIAIALQEVKNN